MNQILTEKSYNSISELPLELRYKIFQYLHIDTKLEILSSRARNEYMNSIFSYYSLEEYYNLYNYVCNVFTDPVLLDKLPKFTHSDNINLISVTKHPLDYKIRYEVFPTSSNEVNSLYSNVYPLFYSVRIVKIQPEYNMGPYLLNEKQYNKLIKLDDFTHMGKPLKESRTLGAGFKTYERSIKDSLVHFNNVFLKLVMISNFRAFESKFDYELKKRIMNMYIYIFSSNQFKITSKKYLIQQDILLEKRMKREESIQQLIENRRMRTEENEMCKFIKNQKKIINKELRAMRKEEREMKLVIKQEKKELKIKNKKTKKLSISMRGIQ